MDLLISTIQNTKPSHIIQLATQKVPSIRFNFWEGYEPSVYSLNSVSFIDSYEFSCEFSFLF